MKLEQMVVGNNYYAAVSEGDGPIEVVLAERICMDNRNKAIRNYNRAYKKKDYNALNKSMDDILKANCVELWFDYADGMDRGDFKIIPPLPDRFNGKFITVKNEEEQEIMGIFDNKLEAKALMQEYQKKH